MLNTYIKKKEKKKKKKDYQHVQEYVARHLFPLSLGLKLSLMYGVTHVGRVIPLFGPINDSNQTNKSPKKNNDENKTVCSSTSIRVSVRQGVLFDF